MRGLPRDGEVAPGGDAYRETKRHGIRFVSTRYQGSKQRLAGLLERVFRSLRFDSAVDVFGGTGAVSHLLKRLGKSVHYNDILRANHAVGVALVENSATRLGAERAARLFRRRSGKRYGDFIERTFDGVFYLREENRWLDVVAQNVLDLEDRYERALAQFALFQACLKKRPFNLFHRKNLDLRTRDVPRSFGNKTTWERPFEALFLEALEEANRAVFDGGRPCRATRLDALACPLDADLVYLDPPYVRADGRVFDYVDGYHFLDGLTEYATWSTRIDRGKKHLPYAERPTAFAGTAQAVRSFAALVERAARARYVVVSYRADGAPSIDRIESLLASAGRAVSRLVVPTSYALARRTSAEVVLVGQSAGR